MKQVSRGDSSTPTGGSRRRAVLAGMSEDPWSPPVCRAISPPTSALEKTEFKVSTWLKAIEWDRAVSISLPGPGMFSWLCLDSVTPFSVLLI